MGQDISLEMDGGAMQGYLALPEGPAKKPGVLVLQEIAGVNFHLRAVTDYFAALGHVALAPNLFWRLGPDMGNDYSKEGSGRSIANHDRANDADAVKDVAVALKYLRELPQCTGKVGAVGYCFGGRLGFLCGVQIGVDAVASLYPTFMERCLHLADQATFPWSVHLPEYDPLESQGAQDRIVAAFKGKSNVELFRYRGAHHAFDSDAARRLFDRWASQLANARIAEFFARTLA